MLSRATHAPVLATRVTRPSASRIRNASRTGTRLAPRRAAISSWRILVPGGRTPARISARSASATRLLVVPWPVDPVSASTVPHPSLLGRSCGMPEDDITDPLVGLAVGKGDKLQLHPPRGEEVDPALPPTGVPAGRRLAENTDPPGSQVLDRSVEVVDVERQVVATDVAVSGYGSLA